MKTIRVLTVIAAFVAVSCMVAFPAAAGGHHHRGGIAKALGAGIGHHGKSAPALAGLAGVLQSAGGHGSSHGIGVLNGNGANIGRAVSGVLANTGRNGGGYHNGGNTQGLAGLLSQGGYSRGNVQGVIGGAISNAQRHNGYYGGGGWSGGGWGGYGYPGVPYDDSYARAYRDVGIANAVAGVVSTIATQGQRTYVPVQTAGQYVRQRVVLQPAHYESTRVWIPETFDPNSGQKLGGGFYEARTQLVPETVEYRDVLVTTPAPVAVPGPSLIVGMP